MTFILFIKWIQGSQSTLHWYVVGLYSETIWNVSLLNVLYLSVLTSIVVIRRHLHLVLRI